MLKATIKGYLKENIACDALYTEKQYNQIDGLYLECSVWSPNAGYMVTVKRRLKSKNRRYIQESRDAFLKQVSLEQDKFRPRFDYEENLVDEDDFNVLLNDGFDYDE